VTADFVTLDEELGAAAVQPLLRQCLSASRGSSNAPDSRFAPRRRLHPRRSPSSWRGQKAAVAAETSELANPRRSQW
jgi:hypothetical protein